MSTKKSEKLKKAGAKTPKSAKNQDKEPQTTNAEPVPEVVLEKPPEIRTIVIQVESYGNILPLYPVSDIKSSLKYLDKDLGETAVVPVSDDQNLLVNQAFELEIDVNSTKQLDLLSSNPIFLTTTQSSGTQDPTVYEQLKPSADYGKPPQPLPDAESIFSLYEAFTGDKAQVQLVDIKKAKKKGKKDKGSDSKTTNKSRSKSMTSKGSKTSKKSKASKGSTVDGKAKASETPAIKSEVYGMCVIDLIPFFYGETSFKETLLLQPIKRSCQILSTFKNFPQVTVTVSIKENQKLIDLENILNFTVESICNVPSMMSTDMDCRVCVLLPLQATGWNPTVFYNPKISTKTPGQEVPKRWVGIQDIGYNANTTKYLIDPSFEDVKNRANLDLGEGFKNDAVRLEFNYLKRNILFKPGNTDFASHLVNYRKLVLEIYLTPKTKKRDKSPDAQSDDTDTYDHPKAKSTAKSPPYLHLMAVLDVASLLYPGVTRVRIAAPVKTFTYEEALKAGLEDSYFAPKPKVDVLTSRTSRTKLDTGRKKKEGKKEKQSKKDKASTGREDKNLASQLPPKPEEPPVPEPSVQVYNEEGNPCFILAELELLNPVTAKREIDDLEAELHELQSEAAVTSKTVVNKNVAEDFYKQTINEIVEDLNKNFISYNEKITTVPVQDYGDFFGYLQKTGAYQSYLNSVTSAAGLVVSNKFKCEDEDLKNSKAYQNLVSQVFTQLLSDMHGVLNGLVCTGLKPAPQQIKSGWDECFFNAKEAAELHLHAVAERYFLERIVSSNEPDLWLDFAIYHLELGEADKAFECTKEAIALSCNHKYSLMLFGVLLAEKRQFQEAETCLLNLLIQASKWAEAWCVLFLFYQKWGRPDGMEMAYDMGTKCHDTAVASDYFNEYHDLAWSFRNVPDTIFFRTAVLLLKMRLFSWAELALAQEVSTPKHYGFVNYLLAVASYYQKDYAHAREHIEEAKEFQGADFAITALSGHILHAQACLKEAQDEYLRVIESFDRPNDIHLVYVRCAAILPVSGEDQKARKLLLIALRFHQTPHVWLEAGKLYFKENDLLSAEECFTEANRRDNRHAEVWGYLTLVNLRLDRVEEAEQCYHQAVKANLDDEQLTSCIKNEFRKVSNTRLC